MNRLSALGDMLGALVESGARLVDWTAPDGDTEIAALCGKLLSARGEASGVALAAEILGRYGALDAAGRLAFFNHLAGGYNPDPEAVADAALAYQATQDAASLGTLFATVEPPRQELLRRLNTAPDGTRQLVAMRADLLALVREHPALSVIDGDFRHLLGSWFNRGFLVMRPIAWDSPASVLEKIIAYEAVHQIDSWDELRRRVQPADRRCYAFFHPSMPDEPLIFVEVALTRDVPGSIQALLAPERDPVRPRDARTAVFYSISNCQAGLAGVSFGAFLIKQVASDLAGDMPGLETFVTLSPVPGLARWLDGEVPADDKALLGRAAQYFLNAKRPDGQPLDPVARFHLGNGAELAGIHAGADMSDKGMAQSLGVMVNYLYRLDRVEANHEAYVETGAVAASRPVRALLPRG